MGSMKEWPSALRRHWLLTIAAGCGFLVIGLAVFLAARDRPLLVISGLLALCTFLRCWDYHRAVRTGRYETVEGICIEFGRAGLGKQRKVRLLLYDGNEYVVRLDKRMQLRIGNRYRIFFRRDAPDTQSSVPIQEPYSGEQFLALEDLGEYLGPNTTGKMEDAAHDA